MGIAADEGRHVRGPEPDWSEVFDLQFWLPDASLGGFVRFEIRPEDGVCWFWTALVGAGRRLVTVLEFGSPIPRWPGLELRGPSLWSELIIETPWEHVSLGLEAFAVELADPSDALGDCRGDLVPLGYDLEWESVAPMAGVRDTYELSAAVHGEILLGEGTIDFDGVGRRGHCWGARQQGDLPKIPRGVPLLAPVEVPEGPPRAWVLDEVTPYWGEISPR